MSTVVEFPKRAKGTIEDPIICHCLGVTASTIRSAIDDSGARTSEEISSLTTAGTGCGSCRCRLERLLAGLPAQCGPCALCPGCGMVSAVCDCHSA